MRNQSELPALPLDEWEQSKITLNFFLQIAGKIRLGLMPRKNHWWYLTFYVSPRGLTTHAIPLDDGFHTFEITFNFIEHLVELNTSSGVSHSFPLQDGLSVASFYTQMFDLLKKVDVTLEIIDKPVDMPTDASFGDIHDYKSYQPEYVERFWRALTWVDHVFKEFGGRFYGKTCPVHLYWHHMDLAVTRFSGKLGPAMPPETRLIEKDAYSHEVISFGFWAGDDNVRGAAFYCYTYPSPEGLDTEPLQPQAASWVDSNGSPMALLMYDDLRRAEDPKATLLDFLESAYQAGAKRADWDVAGFTVPGLRDL